MKFKKPSYLSVSMLLVGLTGCDGPADHIDVGNEHTSTFRSGTISMQAFPEDGYICFQLAYQCDAPEAAGIELDGSTTIWGWAADTQHADTPIGQAPEHVCLYTDDISASGHSFQFRATCAGVTSSTTAQTHVTSHSPVSVDSVVANDVYYEFGDTISLVVVGDTGLAASADFSAIDSGYVSSSETVTSVTGGYQITYSLSTTNTVAAGDFTIPVTVYDPTDTSKSRTVEVELRYLPNGRIRAHVARGFYRPEARPSLTASSSLLLDSVTDTTVDVSSGLADEEPDFSTTTVPTGLTTGRVYDIDFRTLGPNPVAAAAIDVWESSRDGYVRVPLDVSSATCTATQCSYTDSIVIASKTPGTATTSSLPLTMALVAGTHSSSSTNSYLPSVPTPPPGSYLVRGTITHDVRRPTINCDTFPNTDMTCPVSWSTQSRPAKRMSVRLMDDCGGGTQVWTDDEGKFEKVFSTFCPNDPVQVRISSYHEPDPLTISVFDRSSVPPVYDSASDLEAALTDDPADYTVYHEIVETFVPSVDAALPNGHTFTANVADDDLAAGIFIAHTARQALDYYDAWTNLSSQVHVNVLFDSDEVVEYEDENGDKVDGNYNFYAPSVHPGMIHIRPKSEWSAFAMAHETGHLFHHFFLRDHGPSASNPPYGRFGESMSHIHAAGIVRTHFMTVFDTHSTAETMDYNGKFIPGSPPTVEQATMDFYTNPTTAEASLNCSPPNPDACCSEPTVAERGNCVLAHSTGWDWRIFYDLLDPTSLFVDEPVESFTPAGGGSSVSPTDFDGFNGNLNGPAATHLIMDVLLHYLGRGSYANGNYADRGQAMLDVVDVLDGMSCRGHMSISSTRDMLHDAMGYDYDFFYDGTPCP